MYNQARYLDAGDKAVVVELGNQISTEINRKIRNFTLAIEKEGLEGVGEVVPTYRSLLITYDPLTIERDLLIEKLKILEENLEEIELPQPKLVKIPTLYKGEGLEYVSQVNGLTAEEVVELHSKPKYLIYMLGFTPGFVYLGGLAEKLATPRLQEPLTKIPAGSVGIADNQTGIYPIESPGGWQLIGKTPVKLFDPDRKQPILEGIESGNYIKFEPITAEEYEAIAVVVEDGDYQVEVKQIDN
ncbi:5-oxoprolinase subunit PxpB [Natroniella sulfidigena]|uniref:5-oxoprolinase subunit PxpB n=1 Tax=Natroniella sulfidigena TaxID=723921 RepID=UPI00200B68AB|nr:5-oxoprolinase subunit PxpB [Natroniella sulfidigena]MCK8816903.1 5-oxoprolinase subunit PxpB [Natroniella sulfidigena]